MNIKELFLPGLHLPVSRRRRTEKQKFIDSLSELKSKSLSQLDELFGRLLPLNELSPNEAGPLSRRRVFSKSNTFWSFFSQILDADGGCREVVRKLQAHVATKSGIRLSSSTSAYCQARGNLEYRMLSSIHSHIADQLQASDERTLQGRRVIVVDGTGLSMPDTKANQQQWPQYASQKIGCGFPNVTVCACFNLHNGALLSYELGDKKSHELPMLRMQWDAFTAGDVCLGDKGFCSYFDLSSLQGRGVDSVVTLCRRMPVAEAAAVRKLTENDLLIRWQKPIRQKASSYSKEGWEALPESMLLRQIRVEVKQPGFRVKSFHIITTLLDPVAYPANEIADLYFKRWDVELFFRDIKTTMGMDILRCKSPEMVRKEILMHFIVYNCIRSLMLKAVRHTTAKLRRISFKGAVQALRQWEPLINHVDNSSAKIRTLIQNLHIAIAQCLVPERPGRNEPRVAKRRPKPFTLMTQKRHLYESK